MKRLLVILVAIVLVATVSVPVASAWGGHGRFHGGGHFRGHGCFGCGFGFFTGAVLGGALAAPYYYPPYYYAPYYPPPVYAVPPQPYCYAQPRLLGVSEPMGAPADRLPVNG